MSRTKRILLVALVAASVLAGPLLAQETKAAAPAGTPPTGFSAERGNYRAVGEAVGKDPGEAQELARNAALGLLFRGLGKDRLYAEVFVGAPPVGLSFELLSSVKEGAKVRARVAVSVDDESIRIIERGAYLAAAISLLDKAEDAAVEAESRSAQGAAAEAQASLGDALAAYGLAEDSARSGSKLIEVIGDPSIFSSRGKRTAPDLRRSLAAAQESAAAGIGRIRAAQAKLEADETGKAIGESVKRAIAAADRGDALIAGSRDILSDPSAFGPERLSPLRDKLALERRAIADAEADLGRAKAALPKDAGYRTDELDYARRRLDTVDASLASAYHSVDREIRDPLARRTARARALRWVFLHQPTERLSVRAYLPVAVDPQAEDVLAAAPFDFSIAAEGAFPLGQGGVWARTRADSETTDLRSDRDGDEEFAIHQSFSLGFWKRALLYAGYDWDWYRGFDSGRRRRNGQIEFGLGGVSAKRGPEGVHRADWLLALSYDIPGSYEVSSFWTVFNAGLEAQFRLGSLALLEARASERLREGPADGELDAIFRWELGFGLRLPAPFTLGCEFCGDLSWPLEPDGSLGERNPGDAGAFRFYVGYAL